MADGTRTPGARRRCTKRAFLMSSLFALAGVIAGCRVAPTPTPAPAATPTVSPAPAATPRPTLRHGLVNLAHLDFLTEDVELGGAPAAIVHIYSEYPKYEWVDAAGEGIACVDDVARAAIVYLQFYEDTGEPYALERARRLLTFCLHMQAEDGDWYNFVLDRQGTINREGNTSYKSFGFWAVRGMWALATGYRVFAELDPAFAATLQAAYLRSEARLQANIRNLGRYDTVHGLRVPAWLLNQASDQSAIALLALVEYERAVPNPTTEALIRQLASAMAEYQLGDAQTYPFGIHPPMASAPGYWHAWGAAQCQALATAGQALGDPTWVSSARREADTFFSWLLASRMLSEMGALPFHRDQIAYGVNSIVQGYLALWRATGEEAYARRAGLTASWFFGQNIAGVPMYDPETGRGFDGIRGSSAFMVNRNAGAESTIEALMAIRAVAAVPQAARYLEFRAEEATPYQVLEAESAEDVSGRSAYRAGDWLGDARLSNGHYLELHAGDRVRLPFQVAEAGDYVLYVAHLRQRPPQLAKAPQALRASGPVRIDGRLDEWPAALPIRVDSRDNILRGGASWQGPEQDSFAACALWDEENLYLAAEVTQAAPHTQNETGPSVWKGDALWVYMDTSGAGTRVDVKFTLAQTPQGPQVWDWKGSAFLPGARLAWAPTARGYAYEAAIPLAALDLEPKPGLAIGFDIGKGCCGSGFMDLSGKDPDVAANLVPLTFVDTPAAGEGASTSARQSGPGAVALSVQVDGGAPVFLPEQVSPDRDYLWLDRLEAGPLHLDAGPHTLTIAYAGSDPERTSVVDGFLLQPTVLRRTLRSPAGATLRIAYDLSTGTLSWQEEP